MTASEEVVAAPSGDGGETGSFSTAPTATENTPLLRSETASSGTARDVSPPPADESLSGMRMACIVLSMWVLIFLQASNMSGISTIQSTIAADLDAYEYAMWLTSSYLISMSSVGPVIGRLAMQFSPQTMILFSSLWFSVGALVTSQAYSFAMFIFGRILVGIGGGGVMTLSLILVIQLTSKRRRGLMIGLTNAGFTVGISTGAIVFGALLPVIGWRAIFLAQSPLGLLAGIGVYASMPPYALNPSFKARTTLQKLAGVDYAGALTLTITLVLFLYSLSTPRIGVLPLILSLLMFPIFLAIEASPRTANPILPLSILSHRGILLSCLSQLSFMAARWAVLFYSPVWALAIRAASPAVAGSVLIPTNLGFGIGGLLIGWLHVRRAGSFWLPCLVSLAFFGLALLALSFVTSASSPPLAYIAVIFLNGLCTGAALNYTLAHLLHLTEPSAHFIVTGLLSTFRGFAGSFGTSIGGGIFSRTLSRVLAEGFSRLDGGGLSKARERLITILVGSPAAVYQDGFLSDAERVVAVAGYGVALRAVYRAAAALCVLILFLQAGTGWEGPVPEADEDEEEVEGAIEEHDATMEA
ncbi:vacuolar basic amino acid transporter 1 [Echria macrotheca]|uniref:Vacuolar basic amino acid transporter 1 n=1 Tax=Echria macrotheca TaxID=438768 RepID=A0AAJ0BP75_9PEZI|nr:vacuolar basic amino acid transporter 1 [Echria macrotheca]